MTSIFRPAIGDPVASVPTIISAVILPDGVTLRVVFDYPVLTGNPDDGFTRSVSSIDPGSIVNGVIVFAVPETFAGEDAGTISYSAVYGDMAGEFGLVPSFSSLPIENLSTQVPAPVLVSATILADGVTLELVFDDALTSGSATLGFTRTIGSITSGTKSGDTVSQVVPITYLGQDAGDISYDDAVGTLAGAGGPVTSFGPVAITNNSTQALPYATFDPATADPNITLSNGNLTATKVGGGVWAGVKTNITKTSGKWWAEIVFSGSVDRMIGVANVGAPTNSYIGSTTGSLGFYSIDARLWYGATAFAYGATAWTGSPVTIGVGFDFDNNQYRFQLNGVDQGVVPFASYPVSGALTFMVTLFEDAGTADLNCGQNAWAYTPPAGFLGLQS